MFSWQRRGILAGGLTLDFLGSDKPLHVTLLHSQNILTHPFTAKMKQTIWMIVNLLSTPPHPRSKKQLQRHYFFNPSKTKLFVPSTNKHICKNTFFSFSARRRTIFFLSQKKTPLGNWKYFRVFSFRLKCENEGIMEVFWCMPTTVMSSSILLQATTKHSALQIKVSKKKFHKFCNMIYIM